MSPDVGRIYVLHDMDITGRTIFGTLTSDGRRFKYKNNITSMTSACATRT